MSCPTCDHTMQGVADDFWCPRCGTRKLRDDVYRPKLVGLVRDFCTDLDEFDHQLAHEQGVYEAIYKPENRP